jgi:hypothetical protein
MKTGEWNRLSVCQSQRERERERERKQTNETDIYLVERHDKRSGSALEDGNDEPQDIQSGLRTKQQRESCVRWEEGKKK